MVASPPPCPPLPHHGALGLSPRKPQFSANGQEDVQTSSRMSSGRSCPPATAACIGSGKPCPPPCPGAMRWAAATEPPQHISIAPMVTAAAAPAPAPATASSIDSLDDDTLATILRLARSSSSWLQHRRTCLVCRRWRHVDMTHNCNHLTSLQLLQPLGDGGHAATADDSLPVWGALALQRLVRRYVQAHSQVPGP